MGPFLGVLVLVLTLSELTEKHASDAHLAQSKMPDFSATASP